MYLNTDTDWFISTDVSNKQFFPTHQEVPAGGIAKFSCTSDDDVTWKFEGKTLPIDVLYGEIPGWQFINNNYLMSIYNTQVKNSGTYYCYGKKKGRLFMSQGILKVKGLWLFSCLVGFSD